MDRARRGLGRWQPGLARVSLGLTAVAFLTFGLLFLVRPDMLGVMGVSLDTPTARIEVRGFYGGMEIGLGLFFLFAARRPRWFRPGLVAQAASLGGLALGRIVGIVVDGSPDASIWMLISAELVGALVGAAAFVALLSRPVTRRSAP